MNKLLLATTLALPSFAFAHGGTYRGPQDTVPPSGGGGGSGGGGRATPGPAQPGTPNPGPPGTPGAVTPGAPGGNPGGPARPTGGGDNAVDLSAWQFWWAFNKDPFLNLKSHIHSAVVTGSGEYYLGHGERDQAKDMLRPSESMIRERIVPRLLHALRTEESNDIQSSCMIALAKIGDEQGEDGSSVIAKEIAGFLTSGSQELSETAAVALGILGNPAAIDLLSALVSNDTAGLRRQGIAQNGAVSMRTRAFAAYGLGLIGCKASDEQRLAINATLRKLLDGEGRQMAQRDIPVACLTSIGLTPLPAAPLQVGSGDKLGEVLRTREDQLRYLLGYYEDEGNNFLTRAHAPTAMARLLATGDGEVGALRDEVAVALMHSLSKDSRDQDAMKQSCALALGLFGDADEDPTDQAIRAALMRVKDDLRDRQVRHFALIALGQVAGRPGEGAGDPIHAVNTVKKQENARTFLLGELAKDKNGIAPWAGLALAMLERSLDEAKLASSPDAKLALRGALHEAKSPDDIGAFAIASGLVRDVGALDKLLENLEVGDPEARGYTAVGLGLLGETSAMPRIRDLVRKSKYQGDVLKSAAIGLGLLGDKKLVDELIEMLSTSTALSSQAAVSSALGFIGDARSVDPLIALLENQQATGLARAFGAVALGIISDKEDFPWNSKIGVGSNYRANTPSLTDQKGGILDIL